MALPALTEIARALRRQHGAVPVPPPRTAFEWVLWENVAYLADDEKRTQAFTLLQRTVGTTPAEILRARMSALLEVTRHGIVANLFAQRLHAAAQLALDKFDGNVDAALSTDVATATRQLGVFPGIGEPGAEKILVALGRARTLPLDSNGLRVLTRVGFGSPLKSYTSTYRSVKEALPIGKASAKALFAAHLLLQRHGREVCRRSAPECGRCALQPVCAFAARAI
jgi:endonuclease III